MTLIPDAENESTGVLSLLKKPNGLLGKISKSMSMAVAVLFEQFRTYIPVDMPVQTALISTDICSICDIGQRVFK